MIHRLQLTNHENGDKIDDGQGLPIALKLFVLKVCSPHVMRWNVHGNFCSQEQENGLAYALADSHLLSAIGLSPQMLFA
jgi:hypothetical protein